MTESISNYNPTKVKDYDYARGKNRIFNIIADSLQEEAVYTKCAYETKGGLREGWLDNLLSRQEALQHISEGGNVGIALGKWFNGYCYVLLDVEQIDILPIDIQALIDSHAVLSFDSPHTGRNRIVKLDHKDTYDLLRSFPTTITDITEGDSDDLELFTKGHSMIPPSGINHSHCSKNKPCNGFGKDEYKLFSVNPTAEPLQYETVERLGDLLDIEPQEQNSEPTVWEGDCNAPSAVPSINPKKEFNENVPSVKHGLEERINYMKFGDWEGQDLFNELWNGNFDSVSGSNKQGKAECKLANHIGFFMGRNENMIRFIMSTLPFESQYEKYPKHRKNLLEWSTSVDWVYCEKVSFNAKSEIASRILLNGRTTTKELAESSSIDERQIQYVNNILEAEDVIQRTKQGRKNIIENIGITEGYLLGLENVIAKYNSEEEIGKNRTDNTNSNVNRVEI